VTEDYVVVSTVQGQFTEQQIRAFLEAHGIPTHVKGETLRTTYGISVDGLGTVEILVAPEQADEARELLARAERGELALTADEDPDTLL
jgi:hypothetical protein